MFTNHIVTCLLTVSLGCALSGCDYIDKRKLIDQLQQEQGKQSAQLERIEKQQALLVNSTTMLARAVNDVKNRQVSFTFTEFNPTQTKYFILNNGSVGLAGRVLSIDAADNGSVIHMSLVNLLSIPVSNIGFHVTWGSEKPTDARLLPQWQQLLFSTSMNSTLQLLPGQWQDINLSLKGVSPNNLKYLKMAINMENIAFDNPQTAEPQKKKIKK